MNKIKISPSLYDKFKEMKIPEHILRNYEVDPTKPRIEHEDFTEVKGNDEQCPF